MKIGIVTDTHDKLDLVHNAIGMLETLGCDHVIHCGDFYSDHIADCFFGRKFIFHYVTDHKSHDSSIVKYSQEDFIDYNIGNHRYFAIHNTYPYTVIRDAIESDKYNYVLYGHLHFFNIKLPSRVNNTIVINAGGFYHNELSTFCYLNTDMKVLDLYYWAGDRFYPILRFELAKSYNEMQFMNKKILKQYANALCDIRWKRSDKMEYVFSRNEDESWFCKYFTLLFEKLEVENLPGFLKGSNTS